MANYAIITDLNRCTGCLACTVACKAINGVDVGNFWIKTLRIGPHPIEGGSGDSRTWRCTSFRSSASTARPRVRARVPDRRVPYPRGRHRADRQVQVHRLPLLRLACPYGVRYLNEEERVVEKCTMCEQRISQGELPQCVAQCGARARFFGDLDKGVDNFEGPAHPDSPAASRR
ncbi:MAG: 4Fe-4S dicluster domain-containing protein [Senegalimassilia anaerobia]